MNKEDLKWYLKEIKEAMDEVNERFDEAEFLADNSEAEDMRKSGSLTTVSKLAEAVNEVYKLSIKLEGKLEP